MQNKEQAPTFLINPALTLEEKTVLANAKLQMLIAHFDTKARNRKKSFHFYKYASIVLAAISSGAIFIQPTGRKV